MQYNFILIRTDKGRKYARKILNSVKWLNENKYPQHEFTAVDLTIAEFMSESLGWWRQFNPSKTIIHARAANPRTKWTIRLRELEKLGYKVVNSVDCIELTSNKLACSLHLQGKVNHPKSWEYTKGMRRNEYFGLFDIIANQLDPFGHGIDIIAKPYTSLEQGANVKKLQLDSEDGTNYDWLADQINQIPGNKIVIQEYIPYTALHRVIVIGGKALPYTFVDYANDPRKNGEWKVSCCLNRTTMQMSDNIEIPAMELAEKTQELVNGSINFIDIFETNDPNRRYVIGEINTACSLNIHERLARNAGRQDYNIHFRIAKELVKQLEIR